MINFCVLMLYPATLFNLLDLGVCACVCFVLEVSIPKALLLCSFTIEMVRGPVLGRNVIIYTAVFNLWSLGSTQNSLKSNPGGEGQLVGSIGIF